VLSERMGDAIMMRICAFASPFALSRVRRFG
jgi:hypothetical protein